MSAGCGEDFSVFCSGENGRRMSGDELNCIFWIRHESLKHAAVHCMNTKSIRPEVIPDINTQS